MNEWSAYMTWKVLLRFTIEGLEGRGGGVCARAILLGGVEGGEAIRFSSCTGLRRAGPSLTALRHWARMLVCEIGGATGTVSK